MIGATYTAFVGQHRLATGTLAEVAVAVHEAVGRGETGVLVFEDATGRVVDLDLRGDAEAVAVRYGVAAPEPAAEEKRPPGRPRLGVVAREVTLLPRHWEWLASQPGGASVALRRLVDEARKTDGTRDRGRLAREAAYRFMQAVAGDLPGFEAATRALFADDGTGFERAMAAWPADVRDYAVGLAERAAEG